MKIKRTSNVSTDKIYWNRATLIHLHSTGCFCARKAELNTCTERQHLKIYYLALFWKNLLTLPEMWLDNSSCEFMYRYFSLAGAGGPREATPHSRSGGAAMRRYPSSKVRLNETMPCHVGLPRTGGSWWIGLKECGPLEKGMATTSVFLPWEPHEHYEKAKW